MNMQVIRASETPQRQLCQDPWIQEAADIFAGLVELRPADGDALNNLGFCLLPLDPSSGLEELERASLYPQGNVVLNLANRALALHLVGRDEDALQLGREVLGSEHRGVGLAVLWKHDHDTGKLTLESRVDPVHYLGQLSSHLEAMASNSPPGSNARPTD